MSVQQDLAKAKSLMKKGRVPEAREYYFRVLSRFPGNKTAIEALNRIGGAGSSPADQKRATALNRVVSIYKRNQLEKALEMLAEVEAEFEEHPEILNLKGVILSRAERHAEAIAAYERCLALQPGEVSAMVNLGKAVINSGRVEDGIALYRKAIEIQPKNPALKLRLASALRVVGRKDEAIAVLEATHKALPDHVDVLTQLAAIKTFKKGDPQIARMERLLTHPATTEPQIRTLSFALTRAYETTGDYERAFDSLARGNKVRRAKLEYHPRDDEALFEKIKSAFPDPLSPADVADGDLRPIFVVGMPRSGTTLLEQILGSHSQAQGAGEVGWFSRIIKPEFRELQGLAKDTYTAQRLTEVREGYLGALTLLSHGAANVVDKMPTNFRWIGVIAAAFPDAPILHIRRDARATSWSIFRQNFASTGNKYAFDLDEIVQYYGLYEDLMVFWHQLLPGRILDVSYEALTEDPESEVRRILSHCGLEWEPGVLKFHESEGAVRTASVSQVREKIYTGSSDKWRDYLPYLGNAFDDLPGG